MCYVNIFNLYALLTGKRRKGEHINKPSPLNCIQIAKSSTTSTRRLVLHYYYFIKPASPSNNLTWIAAIEVEAVAGVTSRWVVAGLAALGYGVDCSRLLLPLQVQSVVSALVLIHTR